jgi:hypothetical protein
MAVNRINSAGFNPEQTRTTREAIDAFFKKEDPRLAWAGILRNTVLDFVSHPACGRSSEPRAFDFYVRTFDSRYSSK